jgi:hypothetical protein
MERIRMRRRRRWARSIIETKAFAVEGINPESEITVTKILIWVMGLGQRLVKVDPRSKDRIG